MDVQAHEPPPVPFNRCDHVVQFYEDDRFLVGAVAEFLTPGLLAGQGAVVIATDAHREALTAQLERAGVDVDGACFRGRLLLLDAEETLSTFMVGSMPDPELFAATVGSAIEKRLRSSGGVGLRAYGEMVDVLWKSGNPEGALRLEELWNDLAHVHRFSLLCAYSMGNFYQQSDAALLQAVCERHTHVIPVESYLQKDSDAARQREIIRLQQQARVLQTELEERKKLETALRSALAAQRRAEADLRQAQEDIRDFLENAVEGLHWVGPDGRILWANRAEAEMLGYSREEYIGRHTSEVHADASVIQDILARLARNEKLVSYPARLRCKDGSLRDVEISSSVLWRDGKFVHTRCFTREVPAR
jgi:PAS domain S-box-containing protein